MSFITDNVSSNQKVLYIVEEIDTTGLSCVKNEAKLISNNPAILALDQKYLDNNLINKDGIIYVSYNDLRVHLQDHKYDKLFFYSISPRIFQIIDGSDTHNTEIIFRSNISFLYDHYDALKRPYFSREIKPSSNDVDVFNSNKRSLSLYTAMQNISWIFSSDREKSLFEKTIDQSLNNAYVIHNLVNNSLFQYSKRTNSKSLRICIVKDFSNINSQAVDVDIKTILELSLKPFFNQLTISIYGDGPDHDHAALTDPVRNFSNVLIHKHNPSQEEISVIFQNNDFLLYADRFDINKRILLEAGLSGCLPITSTVSTLKELSPSIRPYLSKPEDYIGPVKIIEKFINQPDKLQGIRKEVSNEIQVANSNNISAFKNISLAKNFNLNHSYPYKEKSNKPVLSVIVPSYNVQSFLYNTVLSLINHPLSYKIEVIIVNDGSKDETAKIAKELVRLSETKNGSIVTLIDKENGGHGSTINAGIAAAQGKYLRLLDGDDYVLTDNFVKLIEALEKEESDIVITDLVEDYGVSAEMIFKDYYRSLIPYQQRNLDFMHYNGYGFGEWGPLLSTTNVKSEILKHANFKIDENCFYVDMEYNFIIYTLSKTVVYYPLTIYSYYLGRVGQSMSKESLKRNVLHHEKVTLRLLAEYKKYKSTLSEGKKLYLENKMIIPMCKSQYYITTEMFDNNKNFLSFDRKLKDYPEFYNNTEVAGKIVRLHRKTNGNTVRVDKYIKNLKHHIKKSGA